MNLFNFDDYGLDELDTFGYEWMRGQDILNLVLTHELYTTFNCQLLLWRYY